MSALVVMFTTLMASSIQAILPTWGAMGHAKAPLLLCIAVYYALTRRRQVAVAVAIFLGFVQDSQGLTPVGVSLVAFFIIVFLINSYREEVFILHPVTHAIFGFCASAAADLIMLFLLSILVPGLRLGVFATFAKIIGSAMMAALCLPLVYQAIWHLDLALGNVKKRGVAWP